MEINWYPKEFFLFSKNFVLKMFASFSGKSVTSHLSSSEASRMSWFLFMINLIGAKQLNQAESAKDLSLLKSLNPGTKLLSFRSC